MSGNVQAGDELVLSLTNLTHLFNGPRVDPVSSSPVEVLGISGVDHLLNQLFMGRNLQRARTLVLLLPAENAEETQGEKIELALQHHAEARMEQLRRELRNTYRYGWKATGIAMCLLALCLALSSLFAGNLTESMRPLVRKTFEYGFEIIGWVLLWHPVDVLVFTPLPIRSRIRALQTLSAMSVVVRAETPRKPA